ncbi:MAG: sugar transferase [bacterium]
MKILPSRQSARDDRFPSLARATGLHGRPYLLLRLREELERTRRTGAPFSVLIADLLRMPSALNGGGTYRSCRKLEEQVVRSLASEPRKTDIKGWLDRKRIGVILPDTPLAGAFRFREKIVASIAKGSAALDPERLTDCFCVRSFGGTPVRPKRAGTQDNSPDDPSRRPPDQPDDGTLFPPGSSSFERALKRLVDIAGAMGILLLACIPMLGIAALIRLTSPGPALFRQQRVGYRGRRFVFYKFRSMAAGADPESHKDFVTGYINGRDHKIRPDPHEDPVFKMCRDPRVTRLGRVLRRTSLDELPQLCNVLRGDMSLVGPRPPIPYEVEEYKPWHSARFLDVKPGLTGLWQVSGRSKTSFDDMVRLDLQYADNWSLWADCKILLKTLRAVLSAEGAY